MNLIRYGEKFFDELEIQIVRRREVSAKAELNQISSASSSDLSMAVIRGVKDRKVGISIVDSDDPRRIEVGIERAYKLSRLSDRDDNWPGFPDKQRYKDVDNEILEDVDSDYFVNRLTIALKDISTRKPDAIVVGAEAGAIWTSSRVMNSNGIDVEQSDSLSLFDLVMMGRYGDVVTPSIFDMELRKDYNLNTDAVIDSCLKKLDYARVVKRANKENAVVILEPFALAEILQFALYPAFSGERKVKGTSLLSKRIGERVMSEKITIADDPFHDMSVSKIIADDEGVATRRNVLVDNGIFKGFLWNNYWAHIAGVESTGNGTRSFKSGAMGIGAHNMVMENGKRSIDDIIADIDHGYIATSFQGAHSSNPDTGAISVVANPAFVIDNGEIVGSTVFMLSGNIYDLMSKVVEVSGDMRPVFMMGRGVYPHVVIDSAGIAPVSR